MGERLVPMVAVSREELAVAVREFPSADDRVDFLGGDLADLRTPEAFAALRRWWRCEARERCPGRPPGRVPQTRLALVDGERVVAQVDVRHRLTDGLRRLGGHIGYTVVPSARRRGYGTRAFALSLPVAGGLGLDTVLVTCHHANEPSRRIIEKAGSVLVDRCGDRLRYVVRPDGGPPDTAVDDLT